MVTDLALILVGIVLLYFGGEWLVKYASRLASRWGISPLVIGLTIVAFGTSAPELAASLTAALGGSAAIAMGNVVGSNIANIALILGITALIHPLRTEAKFLKREVPIMIGATLLLVILFLDGSLGRLEGGIFVALLGLYLFILFRGDEMPEVEDEFAGEYGGEAPTPLGRSILGIAGGLVLLVGGARLLVMGATAIARGFGVPELVIGLTLVAVGTSLPELATSVIAAIKREPDIALGNVVGSNVFNILGILGITTLVQPIGLPFSSLALDMGIMVGISLLLLPFLMTGLRLGRREGGFMLALYVFYTVYLYVFQGSSVTPA